MPVVASAELPGWARPALLDLTTAVLEGAAFIVALLARLGDAGALIVLTLLLCVALTAVVNVPASISVGAARKTEGVTFRFAYGVVFVELGSDQGLAARQCQRCESAQHPFTPTSARPEPVLDHRRGARMDARGGLPGYQPASMHTSNTIQTAPRKCQY